MRFGKLTLPGYTTVYGILGEEGELTEQFATNPHCCGVSDLKRGVVHFKPDGTTEISKEEMYDAFTFDEVKNYSDLNPGKSGYDLSWDELLIAYPVEA